MGRLSRAASKRFASRPGTLSDSCHRAQIRPIAAGRDLWRSRAARFTSTRPVAKADPSAINYSTAGINTTPHLTAELLKVISGIQMTHVPYNGAAPAIQAVLGGTVPVAFTALTPAHPHIKNGSLKALAVTGTSRWFDLPDVPTMIELGHKDFVSDTFQSFLAPAKTPAAIVELLSTGAIEILKTPETAEQLRNNGFEVIANGPDGMRRRITEEVPKWRDIIVKADIKPI